MVNKVQDQPEITNSPLKDPANLLDFQRMFPDETACLQYLEHIRWPNGFICKKCTKLGKPFKIAVRPRVLKCRSCYYEESVTAGTVMHRSKTNILVWFWAAYLVSSQTPGISAMELQKKLGIARYETAFQILHKLRSSMVRPNREKIGEEWPIEMDVIFMGGKTKSGIQGKTNQVPVAIAIEIRRQEVSDPKTNKVIKRPLAGLMRLLKLPNKTVACLDEFTQDCIVPGAVIISDDGIEFRNLVN